MSVSRDVIADVLEVPEDVVACANCEYISGTRCMWWKLATSGNAFCSFFKAKSEEKK